MKKRIVVLAILLGSLAAVFGCADDRQEDGTETSIDRAEVPQIVEQTDGPDTSLTRIEVLQIAEQTAESEGYDIVEYNMTGCHYDSTGEDHTWTVFYELKPPTPPGGHFMVSIDDQTKEATLAHGE